MVRCLAGAILVATTSRPVTVVTAAAAHVMANRRRQLPPQLEVGSHARVQLYVYAGDLRYVCAFTAACLYVHKRGKIQRLRARTLQTTCLRN